MNGQQDVLDQPSLKNLYFAYYPKRFEAAPPGAAITIQNPTPGVTI
jgi:hypothetical protein